jgi:prolyl oligopeptidase
MTAGLLQPPISDSPINSASRLNPAVSSPITKIETVTDVLHGVSIPDPYRWLEDANAPDTKAWIEEQTEYARVYLDGIPGRENLREGVRDLLANQSYDSLQKFGDRYFFRKRLPHQEQPGIYMRESADVEDQCLVDPSQRRSGKYSAVKPLLVSPNGKLLLYEVKEGGERTGCFELLNIDRRERLPDSLPRGYLRGFAFAPDGKSFYYVHESVDEAEPPRRVAYQHFLGTPTNKDREVFSISGDKNTYLTLLSDRELLVLLVNRFVEPVCTDVYLGQFDRTEPTLILHGLEHVLGLRVVNGTILALTDRNAPNRRIVELRPKPNRTAQWIDIIPQKDELIRSWLIAGDRIVVHYSKNMTQRFVLFDFSGQPLHLLIGAPASDELFLAEESFVEPLRISRYCPQTGLRTPWSKSAIPFESGAYSHSQVSYPSKDGTVIPMYLVGRRDILASPNAPTIMTAYGGYGISTTPQFSVLVASLMKLGCLFALPNIRGGSEFGAHWHLAAKRRNRQTAFDDFLCAADWLIRNERTDPQRLAIFGGSNSGLLVGAALTQRPELFRAVLCMVPMLDMLRYHLFDQARSSKEEFGTSDDPLDFSSLLAYSPYHNVCEGTRYPATMIVSGDADQNCNPIHARKMTARLQAANQSEYPIFLDYSKHRGHSPVLPLSVRINALTDRLAFLCDQLRLFTNHGGAPCDS